MASKTPRVDKLETNYIINGSLDFWQRQDPGTTGVAVANDYYADRFYVSKVFTFNQNIYRLQDSPNDQTSTSLALKTTSASTLQATDWHRLLYRPEGQMVRNLYNKEVSLVFWVKSTETGEHCVVFRDAGATHSYVATYQINQANTWEKKKITLTLDTSQGTWNVDSQLGFTIRFPLAAGSDFQTSQTNQWIVGNFYGTPNTVQYQTIANAQFQIAQVMLLEGDINPDSFIRAGGDYASELRLCQRYYENMRLTNYRGTYYTSYSGRFWGDAVPITVPKRATPTFTAQSADPAGINRWEQHGINYFSGDSSTFSISNERDSFRLWQQYVAGNATPVNGGAYFFSNTIVVEIDADF